MVILGLVLLLIGLLVGPPILTTLGVILIVIGALLWFVPSVTGGRRLF